MRRLALALCSIVLGTAAAAADGSPVSPPSAPAKTASAEAATQEAKSPDLARLSDLLRIPVSSPEQERLGRIKDFAVDLQQGRLTYARLSRGGFLGLGEKTYLVPATALKRSPDIQGLILDADLELLSMQVEEQRALETAAEDTDRREWLRGYRAENGEVVEEPAGAEVKHQLLFNATDLLKRSVENSRGKPLGTIFDLMVDLSSGEIVYAVLAHGGVLGLGKKLFAIPPRAFSPGERTGVLVLDIERDKLAAAPGFDSDHWPDKPDPIWAHETYQFHGQEEARIDDPAGAQKEKEQDTRDPATVDRQVTQRIRRALVGNDSLSVAARNIFISTTGGVVTLRGVVRSEQERETILEAVRIIPEVQRIDDELEVQGETN